jgi:hypothetical protein
MFGYIRPYNLELKLRELNEFRAFYCGICTSLHTKRYITKFLLTYDSVFYAILLTALSGKKLSYKKRFCGLTLKRVVYFQSDEIDEAARDFILLLKYKLLDDFNDERGIFSYLTYFLAKFLGSSDNSKDFVSLEDELKRLLSEFSEMEKQKVPSVEKLGKKFGEIVALFFKGIKGASDEQLRLLSDFSIKIGEYVYVLDTFDDLERDIRKGRYNPLIYEYGYSPDKSINEFISYLKPKIRKYVRRLIVDIINLYNQLELKTYKSLLDNVIYFGLEREMERVLSRKRKKSDIGILGI